MFPEDDFVPEDLPQPEDLGFAGVPGQVVDNLALAGMGIPQGQARPPEPFTQSDFMRLQRLQNGLSEARTQMFNGDLSPDDGARLEQMIQEQLSPLMQRKMGHDKRQRMEQLQQVREDTAQQEAIAHANAVYRSQGLQDRIATVYDPLSGGLAYLYEKSPNQFEQLQFGNDQQVDGSQQADQEPEYFPLGGGMSVGADPGQPAAVNDEQMGPPAPKVVAQQTAGNKHVMVIQNGERREVYEFDRSGEGWTGPRKVSDTGPTNPPKELLDLNENDQLPRAVTEKLWKIAKDNAKIVPPGPRRTALEISNFQSLRNDRLIRERQRIAGMPRGSQPAGKTTKPAQEKPKLTPTQELAILNKHRSDIAKEHEAAVKSLEDVPERLKTPESREAAAREAAEIDLMPYRQNPEATKQYGDLIASIGINDRGIDLDQASDAQIEQIKMMMNQPNLIGLTSGKAKKVLALLDKVQKARKKAKEEPKVEFKTPPPPPGTAARGRYNQPMPPQLGGSSGSY